MKSIRGQLTIRLLVGGALLLGAAGALLDWQIRRALLAQFDTALGITAQSLTLFIEQKLAGPKVEREGATQAPFVESDGDEAFLLRTSEGEEIQRSRSLGDETLPLRAGSLEAPLFFDATLRDGRTMRCAGLRFQPEIARKAREVNAEGIEVVLVVARDRAPLEATVAAIRGALLLTGLGTLAALVLMVRFGVRGGLTPLARLGESVATVDEGSLGTRFPSGQLPVELQPIVGRLNDLLARIESAFEREQRFTAAAAHELRTPLAELRALADVNVMAPGETEGEREESWRDALAITRRMESLMLRLLDLTRSEDSASILQRERVELVEAVAGAWHPWACRAAERGRTIALTLPDGLTVHTDRALLGIILGNLCGNAAEHAPPGSALRVSGSNGEGDVTLHFRSPAGDLNHAEVGHFFERFWRKDQARTGGRHHGLGLSLAAEFARLLGGSLTAQLAGDELEFTLRLPTGEGYSSVGNRISKPVSM
ncbi:MAG: ATP-binding protein [Chthoniobacteraceae bacterium]